VGVALVANSDHLSSFRGNSPPYGVSSEKELSAPLFGDALALTSAVFYALYVTLLKLRIQDESRINMPLFFGFVGLFNIFFALPVYGLLHAGGIEEVEWPSQRNAWIIILANVSLTLLVETCAF
jgi:solute carrier family 35 protein F5